MRIHHIIILLLSMSLFSCMDNIGMKPNANIVSRGNQNLAFWVCVTADATKDDTFYLNEFKKYRSNDLNVILVNTGKDSIFIDHLVELAESEGLEVHTALGIPSMNSDELTKAIEQAKKNGTKRVFFFDEATLTQEQFKIIKASKTE
ncbi:hypothetical protein J0X14_14965 [Muricauda sp. CAU 1633]|uniref:hypothetical protein n=1 Tax=Allomuricauda sp. CAU 1633 TaxID=2816036 RepID=UPI001A8CFC89|nr:hypothetical protein [Muricauda sp. CAU 1633]MBO0323609.1 hypothetical protein [Muricauda sp. CAU 1633]